ncbi:phosphoglycerate mutase-like protein [Patellaria atrata CBS 101060]|uniref:Phosphoglycerate mutase-like protein n=1 Tax=Patellaria atrata CBS 101060 TaxID=1346257 RepID=A0A9P4VSE5_9PEZI|nr:phosphoglycerate mutase-like protein [Patellaria atrata CBS 101060]
MWSQNISSLLAVCPHNGSYFTFSIELTARYRSQGYHAVRHHHRFGGFSHTPYVATWNVWWHPQRPFNEEHPGTEGRGQGGGSISKAWNILYHLGGNGPWVEKVDGVVQKGIAPPLGCKIEQVHLMSRHAERYPTKKAGIRLMKVVNRIRSAKTPLKGDLAFANTWKYFTTDPKLQLEHLTTTGPFAGTLGAFTTGVRLRTRYAHLFHSSPPQETHPSNTSKTRFWSCDCPRVADTARYFALGFFGHDWRTRASHQIIPEEVSRGADTLTPGDTCLGYLWDGEKGHGYGWAMLDVYRHTYIPAIMERLAKQNPEVQWEEEEIWAMQELCGFETTVRGASKWCDVFTRDEWLQFEYARDVIHYYRAGPGNPYGAAMGWLYLNATTNLLLQGPDAGTMFFSFVHDGDIVPLFAALDLFPDNEHLPVTHIPPNRNWRTSQSVPMGARVIFELLNCGDESDYDSAGAGNKPHHFVRVNVNDGIVAVPGCDDGPGRSCELGRWAERVRKRGEDVGRFGDVCGVEGDERGISFLHQRWDGEREREREEQGEGEREDECHNLSRTPFSRGELIKAKGRTLINN